MNRRLRFCALILFTIPLTFIATIAQALPPEDTQIEEPDSYTHCGAVDPDTACFGAGGGTYTVCYASSSNGQKCQDVVTFTTAPGTVCAQGCNLCASVKHSASCQCDDKDLKTSGSCTYW
jgi:hypothetical protein